jgi:pyruvate/2-oxoglutarate dehydrogenase complex dihydrolipoamide acyltransferase (E2) component
MAFDIRPFPHSREVIVDGGYLAARRHIVHGFLELDVTLARSILRVTSGSDGSPLSFTAFVIASFAKAIRLHPEVQAYRDSRGRLVVFHDVDVSTLIEPSPGAAAIPHVIRGSDMRSVRDISEEIRAVQRDPHPWGKLERTMTLGSRLPRFVRLLYMWGLKLNPIWMKRVGGTVVVSSIGMFGKRAGWGIPFLPSHTLGLMLGGIVEKPMAHEGKIALRECLHATLSFDHDIVDGAPAARFGRSFAEYIESAAALDVEAA